VMKGLFVLCAVIALVWADPTIDKELFCHIKAETSKYVNFTIDGQQIDGLKARMVRVNGYSRVDLLQGDSVYASFIIRPDKGSYLTLNSSGNIICSPADGLFVSLDDYKYDSETGTEQCFTAVLPNNTGSLALYVSKSTGLVTREYFAFYLQVTTVTTSLFEVHAEYDSVDTNFKLETIDDTFVINSPRCPNAGSRPSDALSTYCPTRTLNKALLCHIEANASQRVSFTYDGTTSSKYKAHMIRVNGYTRIDILDGSSVYASFVVRPDKGSFFSMDYYGVVVCTFSEGLVISLDDYEFDWQNKNEIGFTAIAPNISGELSLIVDRETGVLKRESVSIHAKLLEGVKAVKMSATYDSVNTEYKVETIDDTFVINSTMCPNASSRPSDALSTMCGGKPTPASTPDGNYGNIVLPSVLSVLAFLALLLI